MNQLILIFLGGGLGSLARYFLSQQFSNANFQNLPYATLLANIMASFILGIFIGYEMSHKITSNYRLLIAVGFCGGFSTFSTFSADSLHLLQTNRIFEAFLNVALNVLLCILATFVGLYLTK